MKKQSRFVILVVLVAVLLAGQFMFGLGSAQAVSTATFHGTYSGSAQKDFYTVKVTPGSTITAEIYMSECVAPIGNSPPVDPLMRIHEGSSSGPFVEYDDIGDYDVWHSSCPRGTFTSPSGIIVIEATNYQTYYSTMYTTTGPYTLTVTGDLVGNSGDPAAQTFFSPGDNRIDGRPGDRLVVWCNQPGQVVVYGTADNLPDSKKGFLLGVFKHKDLIAAGDKGLSHDAGAVGVVSISLMKGWLWVAWNGGVYKATGQNDFAKSVDFSQCVPANTPK